MFGIGPTELVIVAVLGLACVGGLVGLVVLTVAAFRRSNRQPPLVACPACGRNALAEYAHCPHCGQPLRPL